MRQANCPRRWICSDGAPPSADLFIFSRPSYFALQQCDRSAATSPLVYFRCSHCYFSATSVRYPRQCCPAPRRFPPSTLSSLGACIDPDSRCHTINLTHTRTPSPTPSLCSSRVLPSPPLQRHPAVPTQSFVSSLSLPSSLPPFPSTRPVIRPAPQIASEGKDAVCRVHSRSSARSSHASHPPVLHRE